MIYRNQLWLPGNRLPRHLGGHHAMSAGRGVPHLRAWVKLVAALILLVGLLLSGILAAPAAVPVQALNAPPTLAAAGGPVSSGVNGTLASFTALFPQMYTINMPFLSR